MPAMMLEIEPLPFPSSTLTPTRPHRAPRPCTGGPVARPLPGERGRERCVPWPSSSGTDWLLTKSPQGEHLALVEVDVVGIDAGVDHRCDKVGGRVRVHVAVSAAVEPGASMRALVTPKAACAASFALVAIESSSTCATRGSRKRLDLSLAGPGRESRHDREAALGVKASYRALEASHSLGTGGVAKLHDHVDPVGGRLRCEPLLQVVEETVAVDVGADLGGLCCGPGAGGLPKAGAAAAIAAATSVASARAASLPVPFIPFSSFKAQRQLRTEARWLVSLFKPVNERCQAVGFAERAPSPSQRHRD